MAAARARGSVCRASYSTAARCEAKLTLAWCTPSVRWRVFSMRAAQAAQLMPVIGSETRSARSGAPSALPDGSSVRLRVSISVSVPIFHDEPAAQHVHAAGKGELAGLLGRELHRRGPEG